MDKTPCGLASRLSGLRNPQHNTGEQTCWINKVSAVKRNKNSDAMPSEEIVARRHPLTPELNNSRNGQEKPRVIGASRATEQKKCNDGDHGASSPIAEELGR